MAWIRDGADSGGGMFGFFSRNKKYTIDRSQSLESIPVHNEGVSHIEQDGRIVIKVRTRPRNRLLARFQPPVRERVVKLDALGSFVYKQIDNQKTAHQIIEAFIRQYKTNRREATLSTVEFLKLLAARGVISIVVP